MITTVTMAPAFDRTYYVDNFTPDAVNRAWQVKLNFGGKGINFSLIMAQCHIDCTATGFMGEGGDKFEKCLAEKGAASDFVKVSGDIRTNVKICDVSKGIYTDLNECAGTVQDKDIKKLYAKVDSLCKKSDMLYMGGTLPPGAAPGTYRELIEIGKKRDTYTILDASGDALREGILACPDLIKPNKSEAEEFLGREIKTVSDAAEGAQEMMNSGAKTVLLSLGGDGAVLCDKSGVYYAKPLPVSVKSTTGAGDSALAGFVYGKCKKMGNSAAFKYAVSFSSAKIQTEGVDIPPFSELSAYIDKIICEQIK